MDIFFSLPKYLNSHSQRTTSNKSIIHLVAAVVLEENNITAVKDWWINSGFIIKCEVKLLRSSFATYCLPFSLPFFESFSLQVL